LFTVYINFPKNQEIFPVLEVRVFECTGGTVDKMIGMGFMDLSALMNSLIKTDKKEESKKKK
jgi:hypothetical protein